MTRSPIRIDNQPFALGKRIGKGGEGEIFAIDGKPDAAVKLYHDEKRATRELKVRAMVVDQLADKTGLVAFPRAIATDARGYFIGFEMRLFSGYRPVHQLYSPKSRKAHFPAADYRFLVRAALNVANAVVKVHQSGCVIGDFNHSGVLVSDQAMISLIDADSFQYSSAGTLFPCLVGVPDFTPPELHGADLSAVSRTQDHDNFGLAVAIFHLLAMGKHPYAGRFAGGDLSMSEAIAQHRFAFSQSRAALTRTVPPPGSVSLKDFSPLLAAAFEAAFGEDPQARPSAAVWATRMKELERALSRCGKVRTHYYPSAAASCPWCRVITQSAVNMFPDMAEPALQAAYGQPFDLRRITAQFEAIKLPDPTSLLPEWPGQVNLASAAVAAAKRTRLWLYSLAAGALLGALVGLLAATDLAIVWAGIGLVGAILFALGYVRQFPFKTAYGQADARVRTLQQAFIDRLGIGELLTVRFDVQVWLRSYRELDRDLAQDMQSLKASRETRKRDEFLDRFLIRAARIGGITPARTAILASYGIETAADITPDAVRNVPDLGDAITANLLAWRRSYEDRFVYSPVADAADVQAENAVRAHWAARRLELQTRIRSAMSALQTAPQQLATRARNRDAALMDALAQRAQAAHNLKQLGMTVAAPAPLIVQNKLPASVLQRNAPKPAASAPNCPLCGSSMIHRTTPKGYRAGRQTWSCSRYPVCRGSSN